MTNMQVRKFSNGSTSAVKEEIQNKKKVQKKKKLK